MDLQGRVGVEHILSPDSELDSKTFQPFYTRRVGTQRYTITEKRCGCQEQEESEWCAYFGT